MGNNLSPQPISTLQPRDKMRFLGLILDIDIEGQPFWETIELLQFYGNNVFNLNSGNYTDLFDKLTHWLPEPPLPEEEQK